MKKRKMGRVAAPPVMGSQGVQVNEYVRPYVPTIIGGMGQEEKPVEYKTTLREMKLTLPLVLGIGAGLFIGYKLLKG